MGTVTQLVGVGPGARFRGALIDSLLFQGDFIWIEPVVKGQYGAPIGARVISSEAGKILIVDDQGNVGLSLEY